MSVKEKKAAAYGQLIIYLAQEHGGRGWLAYDRLFHQQIASGSSLAGNKFAPSLMASTVLSSGYLRTTCQLCNGVRQPLGVLYFIPLQQKNPLLQVT